MLKICAGMSCLYYNIRNILSNFETLLLSLASIVLSV